MLPLLFLELWWRISGLLPNCLNSKWMLTKQYCYFVLDCKNYPIPFPFSNKRGVNFPILSGIVEWRFLNNYSIQFGLLTSKRNEKEKEKKKNPLQLIFKSALSKISGATGTVDLVTLEQLAFHGLLWIGCGG